MINDLRDFAAHKLSMKKSVVAEKIQVQLTQLQNSSNFMPASMIRLFPLFLSIFFLFRCIFFS